MWSPLARIIPSSLTSVEVAVRPMLTSLRGGPTSRETVVHLAAKLLFDGRVIALPTDTIYGLAALVQNPSALKTLYQIKGRDFSKPVAICVPTIASIHRWAEVTVPNSCLERLLPGPFTLVFERTLELNPDLNPQTSLIGIRIPDFPFIQDVTTLCGEESPVALTSANLSGEPSARSVEEFRHLWPSLGGVFDAGEPLGKTEATRSGSTVVDLSRIGRFRIIREGCAFEQTRKVLVDTGLTEDLGGPSSSDIRRVKKSPSRVTCLRNR
ncbi:unnamed protein product [Cyprideis torosa]|uniref:Threonylcarbamoyl-AMP synthase n=1 Tax=Cyprideis torosa TaxID=163714 RepID=A0A7R8WG97_9CRUS|nr:unnamed protein product [Cyprideis torosa]CAG0896329.1 unnamed protein product [Cyprideis torosa]